MGDSLSSIHHDWPRLIMLCASALAVLLWSAALARAGSFDDQTASLFIDVDPIGLPVSGYPANWGDYNNDGYVDLNVYGRLWKNNGGTSFTYAHWLPAGPWGDYDNDGLLDSYGSYSNVLYRNQSTDVTTSFDQPIAMPPVPAGGDISLGTNRAASWADYNGDGYLDLFVTGYETSGMSPYNDTLMMSNSATSFSGSTIGSPANARGVTSCDWDSDGDQDAYVTNYRLQANRLWRNNGAGSFTNVAGTHNATGGSGHGVGSAWGDIDNDGLFDLFVGNFAHPGQPQSRFLENLGPGADYAFQDKGTGGVAWVESFGTPTLGDYDNDGDLDLFFTTVYSGSSPVLYRNDGNWNFTNVTAAEGLSGIGPTYQAAWADIDNDGDLDLVTGAKMFVSNVTDPTEGNSNHWLRVNLKGDGTAVNAAAIGSQVRITVGGKTLTRQVEGGTGEGNQNDPTLHFGLGDHSGTVDLVISWPDGTETTVTGVAVDQTVNYSVFIPTPSPAAEVFKAGFEVSEGYTDSTDGSDEALTAGYIGHISNQEEWYGENYVSGTYGTHSAVVSDDRAHSGTQSMKIPNEHTYYNYYNHPIPEKKSGTLTIEFYAYTEGVDTADPNNSNNLVFGTRDRFDTNGVAAGNEYAGGQGPGGHLYEWGNDYGANINADTPDSINVYQGGDIPGYYAMVMAGIGSAQWVGRRVVIDIDAGTADFYYDTGDGWKLAYRNSPLWNSGTEPNISDVLRFFQICAGLYFDGTTSMYLDDLRVLWAPPGIFGDADGDWLVDSSDLAIWQQNYDPLGLNDNTFSMGDWNADGFIDSADLALWQQYYDPIGPAGLTLEHTPEPATLFVMTAAGLPLLLKRRRRPC